MILNVLQDLRSSLGPVRDQGRRPTCLSFAASAVHEQARTAPDPLCVEWLFYHAAQRAGTGPREGTKLPDTRRVLHDLGQPLERIWPYNGLPPSTTAWRPPVGVAALFRCGSDGCRADLAHIREALDRSRPVVLALFVSGAFTVDLCLKLGLVHCAFSMGCMRLKCNTLHFKRDSSGHLLHSK